MAPPRPPSLARLLLVALGLAASGCGGPAEPAPAADRALFERMRTGELSPREGLEAVGASDGWPIRDGFTFVFALADYRNRGPWRVELGGGVAVLMTRSGDLWWAEVALDDPAGLRYRFIDGRGTARGADWARRVVYEEGEVFGLVEAEAGYVERWFGVHDADDSLLPRTVRVWVPTGPPRRHLYVHDGQNLFDPAAPYGGWRLSGKAGPETLVVGIDNTAERMSDYTPVPDRIGGTEVGGGGDDYADFVLEDLRPRVEARFGVPERRGVMGSSLGGLIAAYQGWRDPEAWDFAAGLSSTLGWGRMGAANPTLVETWTDHRPVVVYLDSGGGPGSGCVDADGDGIRDDTSDAADNYCETVQMVEALEAAGYVEGEDLHHVWDEGAPHNEGAWAARVAVPMALFEGL